MEGRKILLDDPVLEPPSQTQCRPGVSGMQLADYLSGNHFMTDIFLQFKYLSHPLHTFDLPTKGKQMISAGQQGWF